MHPQKSLEIWRHQNINCRWYCSREGSFSEIIESGFEKIMQYLVIIRRTNNTIIGNVHRFGINSWENTSKISSWNAQVHFLTNFYESSIHHLQIIMLQKWSTVSENEYHTLACLWSKTVILTEVWRNINMQPRPWASQALLPHSWAFQKGI